MKDEFEQIVQGKYNYFQAKKIYCEENFEIIKQNSARGDVVFRSEVLSRSQNGEFLKIEIEYRTTHDFSPKEVTISRFMGGRKSVETFDIISNDKIVSYKFESDSGVQYKEINYSGILQVATPAISTSFICTLKKRIDPVHRSYYTILQSSNVWDYESGPTIHDLIIEQVDLNTVNIKVADLNVAATHCAILLDSDSADTNPTGKDNEEVFFSKHFSLPYKVVFKDYVTVEVAELKVNNDRYANLF